ncbi:conserved Plasmodium protein, unknown function [Plasmodium berghei]|uniref:Uncharacterized protein n=2 Tax=Plasmodium berghei TaxID=5821 RepID=A0A509APN1_PLABA|nr:conserved Plasmodium protein, unknown function [Plasmodium berghei ANKA]CXI91327.1 conserved Plasmodium protein, unknown function [Plasmodium berghei]SCL96425.1 conserved Plasmodium protein, unknown function [Plasmodium berghei]SCM16422.1 conserved Plasmodium protein, unknown function [Plasmodium berghei]SCM18216.1 conserved Plasmodium protein, unknown function [Plasmodium berghei]SCN27644.1 conserved Plasmodium protein, unknown function [Plasmodium berghei]|eukprot:XP_034423299.1 conserved Plasmodium protein, unknown function [Plasmodium berghei ANKA]
MFSLLKSYFSNSGNQKELRILIIGEGGSGKTSLFNLIANYHNKSKYDIINTQYLINGNNGNCSLGFNTKKICVNKRNLQIYDIEGTKTNTINIYDCYYDDTDVIFYVIDAKCECNIFKLIIYLCYLCTNGINAIKKKKKRKKETEECQDGKNGVEDDKVFIKPIIILGNKSEEFSYYSSPCIYNYIRSLDIYENEKFKSFFLSNDNIYLNDYLSLLYKRVVELFIVNNAPLEKFILKENDEKNEVKKEAMINKFNQIINNIKLNNKSFISIDELENNEILSNIMKDIINKQINNYKHASIEVYNISVLKNKGVYDVIETVFLKYCEKDTNTNETSIHVVNSNNVNITKGNQNYKKLDGNPFVASNSLMNGNVNQKNEALFEYKNNLNEQKHTYGNDACQTDHINTQKMDTKKELDMDPHNNRSNKLSNLYNENNSNVYNSVIYYKNKTKKQNFCGNNKECILYENNKYAVNIFIEHIQHTCFGKNTYENIADSINFFNMKNKELKDEILASDEREKHEKNTCSKQLQDSGYKDISIYEEVEVIDDENLVIPKEYTQEKSLFGEKKESMENYSIEKAENRDTEIEEKLSSLNEPKNEKKYINCSETMEIKNDNNGILYDGISRFLDEGIHQNDYKHLLHIETKNEAYFLNGGNENNTSFEVDKSNYDDNKFEHKKEKKKKNERIQKSSEGVITYNESLSFENCTNNISYTYYSSNEENGNNRFTQPQNEFKENINKGEGAQKYVYKSKINKKRYSCIKKKRKETFLHNTNLNDSGEYSSDSLEDTNLMNVMCIDSLKEI